MKYIIDIKELKEDGSIVEPKNLNIIVNDNNIIVSEFKNKGLSDEKLIERLEYSNNLLKYGLNEYCNFEVRYDGECHDMYNYTPLMQSVFWNHYDCVKFIVNHGGNIFSKDGNESNLIHISCLSNSLGDDKINLIRFFIERGVDINGINKFGQTPLISYIINNEPLEKNILEFLIFNGSNIKHKDIYNKDAYSYICEYDDDDDYKYDKTKEAIKYFKNIINMMNVNNCI